MRYLFLLFAIPCFGQNMISIWAVAPSSVCPGDSIKIHYKIPGGPGLSPTHDIRLNSILIASYSTASLQAQPQELVGTDMCYYIKVLVPQTVPPATYTVFTATDKPSQYKLTVIDCCSLQSNFTYTITGNSVAFSATPTGTSTPTGYTWNFGTMSGWQGGTANPTRVYSPGTYTVGLITAAGTCTNVVYQVIIIGTVRISEHQPDQIKPVYYDLYGNAVAPRPGEILIEQRGTIRKKILIQ